MCFQPKEKFRTNERRTRKEWKYKDADGYFVHGKVCLSCARKKRAMYRIASDGASDKKYEKTPNGFLMRMYRNMSSRVLGIQYKKAHLYSGLEILGKEEFYAWAKDSKEFWILFKNYQDSGYKKKLAPTVDRIDSTIGYKISNMRWLTHSENSRLGSLSLKRNKPRTKIVDDTKSMRPFDEPSGSIG
jgi:hypothetical protein